MVLSIQKNQSIWPRDGNFTVIFSPDQSGLWSNDYGEILPTP